MLIRFIEVAPLLVVSSINNDLFSTDSLKYIFVFQAYLFCTLCIADYKTYHVKSVPCTKYKDEHDIVFGKS